MVIFQRNILVKTSISYYNGQLITFGLSIVMCVHFLSELLYDVQRIHIISFRIHALLYHTILFGEHAVEQFIIRHAPKHTDCVDNDTRSEKRTQMMVIPIGHRVCAQNPTFRHEGIHGSSYEAFIIAIMTKFNYFATVNTSFAI